MVPEPNNDCSCQCCQVYHSIRLELFDPVRQGIGKDKAALCISIDDF